MSKASKPYVYTKQHEINNHNGLFIRAYYAPDEIINPIIDWANTLDLQAGSSYNPSSGEMETWDGIKNSHKECYENVVMWPASDCQPLRHMLKWVHFAMENYMDTYPLLRKGGAFKMDPVFNFQKYPKGHSYKAWHCERGGIVNTKRMLAWMIYLNDCEDGGETSFLYQKYNMKPEKGLLVFWPSDFTHTHRGIPSFKTEKKILTGWYSYLNKGDALSWN